MEIELNLSKALFSPKLFPLLFDYSHRWEVYLGGAGSGKSYFITQKLIVRCLREPIKVLVCRRYATTIRNSCFALFKEILSKWKLMEYIKIRETDFNIRFPNGSEIIFIGLDDETKLLSLTNISTIFIEEVYEVSKEVVEQLNLRMRGKANNQQILMAFNPISKHHWLYDFCEVSPPQSFYFSKTTYKDNPFLSPAYIQSLEELIQRNPAKARIYTQGLWGVPSEGLVLTNWTAEQFDIHTLLEAHHLEHRCGMDLGFVDKTAIIDSWYDAPARTIYITNEFYKSGCQLSELADAITSMGLSKSKLCVDAAEPRTIQFFRLQGINAVPCAKGKDSVKAGLMFLQDNKLVVSPSCVNLITELENFSYIKSKQTGEYTDDTTHEWSHAIDALRYGYSDIYTNKKLKTLDKSVLGL